MSLCIVKTPQKTLCIVNCLLLYTRYFVYRLQYTTHFSVQNTLKKSVVEMILDIFYVRKIVRKEFAMNKVFLSSNFLSYSRCFYMNCKKGA